MKYKATLINGGGYAVKGTRFMYGEPVTVSESMKEYLEENAVVRHKAKGGRVFAEPRFEFELIEEGKKAAKEVKADVPAEVKEEVSVEADDASEDDKPNKPAPRGRPKATK